ncbi:uncharacterized protein LOC141642518 [Silene latifolia]|uniref:uncharacterized protein LOC141642518 n=1 Tax=Silene latifolia TaxID=37657 RepID=UPI003D7750D0
MGSAIETERTTAPASTSKTPDIEVDKMIDSDDEESGYVVVRPPTSRLVSFQEWKDGVDTWMAESDVKVKALTDVLLHTQKLVRSLIRSQAQAAATEEAHASESLDTEDPEEREDLLAPEVPVKEEEIRAVLLQRSPLTPSELVATFEARLKSLEDKKAFAEILKRISKIKKMNNNQNYVVLRK